MSPTWAWQCRVGKPSTRLRRCLSTRPWRCLLLGHGEVESESLLLGHGDASYSTLRKLGQNLFYSAAMMPSTRPRRCLILRHEQAEPESFPLG